MIGRTLSTLFDFTHVCVSPSNCVISQLTMTGLFQGHNHKQKFLNLSAAHLPVK